MAAVTPVKPTFYDVTSRGKVRIWTNPTISLTTAETLTIPGVKRVFSVENAKTGVVSWTSSSDGHGNTVISMVITASTTGQYSPLTVYGQ